MFVLHLYSFLQLLYFPEQRGKFQTKRLARCNVRVIMAMFTTVNTQILLCATRMNDDISNQLQVFTVSVEWLHIKAWPTRHTIISELCREIIGDFGMFALDIFQVRVVISGLSTATRVVEAHLEIPMGTNRCQNCPILISNIRF